MTLAPKPFRERPRVTTIEDGDVFPLSRMLPGGTASTFSITWVDMTAQIVAEVSEARQSMVDSYNATIAWVTSELATKAPLAHTHSINGVVGLSDALSGLSAAKLNVPGTPATRTIVLGTAYRAVDPTKHAFISASVETAYTVSLVGTQQDTVELRIGPDATTVANGTGGYVVTTFRSSLTGIAVTIGMGQVQRSQLATFLPAGWYFALRRTVGTTATIQGCVEHPFA